LQPSASLDLILTERAELITAAPLSPFSGEKNSLSSPKHNILLEQQMTEAVQKPRNPRYTQNKTKIHQSNTTLFQKEYHLYSYVSIHTESSWGIYTKLLKHSSFSSSLHYISVRSH